MSGNPDSGGSFREGRFNDEQPVETEPVQSSFFTRWGWPLSSLAAFVIFELTTNLMWSSLVFTLRFGWKDTYAGWCFWWRDQQRARGAALALLHFAAATSKVFTFGFFLLLILVGVSIPNGGQPMFQKFGMVVMSMIIAFLGGMFASGVFGVAAIVLCYWTGRKMWVDRQSYQQVLESDWLPQRFAANRSPTICFFTMIPVTAGFLFLTLCVPLVVLGDPLNRNPPMWPLAFLVLSPVASLLFFLFGVRRIIRTVTAMTPFECWPELFELPIEESLEILESIELPNGGMGIHKEFSRKTRSQ